MNEIIQLILGLILIGCYYYLRFWLNVDFYAVFPIGLIGGFFTGQSIRGVKRIINKE